MLALPLALDHDALALVAYIGGFSAATGMVIVASVALATMVSNDLVMPAAAAPRLRCTQGRATIDRAGAVGAAPRPSLLLALMAYGYYRGALGNDRRWRSTGCWRSPRWRSSRRR